MKNIVMVLMVALSFSAMGQENNKPLLEKTGNLVKATYFHENGSIAQTGYLLKGKLHGQWLMYNEEGQKMVSGKYEMGKKDGKWLFWEGEILKEVDFKNNQIINVKNWNRSEVVAVN